MDIRRFLEAPVSKWPTDNYTTSQVKAFNLLTSYKSSFITGPAGTGKTFMIQEFRRWAEQRHLTVATCATTGCAAYLIGGVTVHSWAHIGLGDGDVTQLVRRIRSYPKARQRWLNTDVLIIDEISMMSPELLGKLETCAREIRGNTKLFGGIQLVAVGDFYQLPPVMDNDDSDSSAFCFQSPLWDQLFPIENTCTLNEIVRQDDPAFQTVLNKIRVGQIDDQVKNMLESRIVDSKQIKIQGVRPTRIFPHRYTVDNINHQKLGKLKGDVQEFVSEVTIGSTDVPLNQDTSPLIKNLPCQERLQLTRKAQVMLIVNLDQDRGLVNGSRGVVTGFQNKNPVVKFVSGITMVIEPHRWTIDNTGKQSVVVRQIPLILAWAMTIHKSQGGSLDLAEIDIGSSLFEYGQAYVALSRVRYLNGLRILNLSLDEIRAHPVVQRFYQKILQG